MKLIPFWPASHRNKDYTLLQLHSFTENKANSYCNKQQNSTAQKKQKAMTTEKCKRRQKMKLHDWSTVITSPPWRNWTFISTSLLSQSQFRIIFLLWENENLGKEKGPGKTLNICKFMKLHLIIISPSDHQMLLVLKCLKNNIVVQAGYIFFNLDFKSIA